MMIYHTIIILHGLGIAINNKQQLVVAKIHGKRVAVIDKSGKEVRTIEDYKFRDPRGVAASLDRTIYLTDSYTQRVFKITPQVGWQNYWGKESVSIKIINNQL